MKRLFAVLLSLCILSVFAACAKNEPLTSSEETVVESSEPVEEITDAVEEMLEEDDSITLEAYGTAIHSISENIYDVALILSNMGKYENSFKNSLEKIGGIYKPENAVENAIDWYNEKAETDLTVEELELVKEGIDHDYKDILAMKVNDDVSSYENDLTEMVTNYHLLHDLILNPEGNFVDNFNEYIGSINKIHESFSLRFS